MPNLKLDVLSKKELERIEKDYDSLINDSQLNSQIVLCKKTEGTYSPGSGIIDDSWEREGLNALRGNYSNQEIAMGIGMWQLREAQDTMATIGFSDIYFMVREADFLEDLDGDIQTDDLLFELRSNSGTCNVSSGDTAILGSGTSWVKNAGKGNWLRVNYEETWYEINTVASVDSLTLVSAYGGATKTYKPHEVYTEYKIAGVQRDVTGTLRKIHCRRMG
jgi:hypothetical protein